MNPTDYRALQAKQMSEEELQALVIAAAVRLGYVVYHTRDSRKSSKGFPDLCMIRANEDTDTTYPELIFAELKSEKGKLTPEQQAWLDALQWLDIRTRGKVAVSTWRPSDWFNGRIERELVGCE